MVAQEVSSGVISGRIFEKKEPSQIQRLRAAWRGGNVTWQQAAIMGAAELVGTALLVAMACMGCLPGWDSGAPPQVQYSLSTGLVVMFVVQVFAHISGAHVNPSVTLCAVLYGTMSLAVGAVYILAQGVGAVLGYGILLLITPDEAFQNSTAFCVTLPHPTVSAAQAVMVEALATSVLILLTCSVWDSRNKHNSDSIPLKFGFTVAVLNMCASSYTGCSMNPIRSLGPVIWTNQWSKHWIYWIGPLLGSALSTILYCTVFRKLEPMTTLQDHQPLNEMQGKSSVDSA